MLPDLAPAEAPLQPASALPACLTRLIGREEALAELQRLLAGSRLLTLTGPGGSGKTRLALELARRVAAAGGPVTWVELAALGEPQLLAGRAAAAAGIREHPGRSAEEALGAVLGARRHLLVLDNCEHLVEAVAELVERLLGACPALTVLATSREALRVPGERSWLVPPLAVPAAEPADGPAGVAGGAVELFAERAAEASRGFALDAGNLAAVARICRRLDGLPLAIELAAARVGVIRVEQIAERLDDAFRVLGNGTRRGVPRHRTLRAAIDWSWSLLAPAERRLLACLAVFAGGFTLEAAEAVGADCEAAGEGEVLDRLAGLAGKSLVLLDDTGAAPRYRLLETVRQYALERLREAGEADEERAHRRHAELFLAVAREAEPALMSADLAALDALEPEHDNVRAALAWSRASGRDEEIGLPLAAAFHWFWYYRVLWSEGLGWLQAALAATDPGARHAARAGALRGAGAFAWYLGDTARALGLLAEGEALWRELGEPRQLAFTLALHAQALADRGELDAALRRAEEATALARRSPRRWDLPYVLTNGLAFVRQRRGELAAADALLAEAAAVWQADRHRLGLPFALNAQARLALLAGDADRAERLARQALERPDAPPDPWFDARALRTLAYCALRQERPVEAARLLGAAAERLRAIGAVVMPFERAEHDAALLELRAALPAEELAAALEAGRTAPAAGEFASAAGSGADEATGAATGPPLAPLPAVPGAYGAARPGAAAAAGGAATTAFPALLVRALGPVEITLGDRDLSGTAWGATRARELLFLLLCHPAGRTKEQVGLALWPDASPAQVHNSFHVTVHRLRKALGDPGWVVLAGDRYRLDPVRPWELDAARFEEETAAALAEVADLAAAGAAADAALARLEAALARYGGNLFDTEEVGDWHLELRDRLQRRFCDGMLAVADGHALAGRPADAAAAYRRVLATDELHEEACRGLMRSLARAGERAAALRAYRELASRLWDELGTEPDPETTELFERLQAGERP